jgi:hypothetical protein
LGPGWQLLGQIDGCDQPLPELHGNGSEPLEAWQPGSGAQGPEALNRLEEAAVLKPWQLASYRIKRLA